MWPARAHRRAATAPACLSSPSTPGRPERRHAAAPVLFPSLSLSLLPGSLFPERTRAQPPPSLAVAVATGLPSPPRHASQLRHDPLYLLVKPRTSGRAPSPTPLSSSPPTPEIDFAAITVNSPDAGRPRAHRPALRVRREPLFLSPHLSLSRVPCSRCPASARSRRPPWPASAVPRSTSASRR